MTLVALAVAVLAVVGSVVFVVLRSIELWRSIRGFFAATGGGLDELSRRLDALAAHEPPELERLGVSLERLRRSQARLAVLTNALRRVREQTSGALALYPRK
jgi:predicted PurR-regulated permease PerM